MSDMETVRGSVLMNFMLEGLIIIGKTKIFAYDAKSFFHETNLCIGGEKIQILIFIIIVSTEP